MMPPDVPPTTLYARLSQMPRPFRVVDFPRLGEDGKPIGRVAIRALNGAEFLRANVAADDIARAQFKGADLSKSAGYANAYSNALRAEHLLLAVRDADDPTKPVFAKTEDIHTLLSVEEAGALYLLFLDVTEQIGPVLNAMSGAEVDAWIERLIEGGETADANSFISSGQYRTLALTMASRLGTLQMLASSSGTPPDGTNGSQTSDSNETAPGKPDLSYLGVTDAPHALDGAT